MKKIPILNNKTDLRKKYSNQRSSKKGYIPKKEINNKRSHSFIFNYPGLKNILLKYNLNKGSNKIASKEGAFLTEEPDKIENKITKNSLKYDSLTKLIERNNDIDLILAGIKTNLEGSTINSEMKIINAEKFISQITNSGNKNLSLNKKSKNEIINNSYDYLKYSFSYMKICNFHIEFINQKKHFINIDDIKEKSKLKYIFDDDINNDNEINVESLIDLIYDYKNKIRDLKLSNKSTLSKYNNNDDEINKEFENYLEINRINEDNKKLKDEIEFLTEKLTYSFYKREMLLNKYYNKLKDKDINIKKNIEDITNDFLT
jgi:hypothetical protein